MTAPEGRRHAAPPVGAREGADRPLRVLHAAPGTPMMRLVTLRARSAAALDAITPTTPAAGGEVERLFLLPNPEADLLTQPVIGTSPHCRAGVTDSGKAQLHAPIQLG